MSSEKVKRVPKHFKFKPDLYDDFKKSAALNKETMTSVLEDFMEKYVKKTKKDTGWQEKSNE